MEKIDVGALREQLDIIKKTPNLGKTIFTYEVPIFSLKHCTIYLADNISFL